MLNKEILHSRTVAHPAQFAATSWSAVAAAARDRDTARTQEALAGLCQSYWPPLHAYVRRLGHNADDAKDLTQQFFFVLISKNYLGAADRTKGKFRTFLLTALRHFLTNEWDKSQAQKRGAGQIPISLDDPGDEDGIPWEPSTEASPMKVYEQRWAMTLFRRAVDRLRKEQHEGGKGELFDALKGFLEETTPPGGYEEVASRKGMTTGHVRVAVHRLRQRLAELVRQEVADTMVNPTPEEIEAEVQHLFEAFET